VFSHCRKFVYFFFIAVLTNGTAQSLVQLALSLIYFVALLILKPFSPIHLTLRGRVFDFANLAEQVATACVAIDQIIAAAVGPASSSPSSGAGSFFIVLHFLVAAVIIAVSFLRPGESQSSPQQGPAKEEIIMWPERKIEASLPSEYRRQKDKIQVSFIGRVFGSFWLCSSQLSYCSCFLSGCSHVDGHSFGRTPLRRLPDTIRRPSHRNLSSHRFVFMSFFSRSFPFFPDRFPAVR
jgi:hypothetical protein